jgi:hypothetical protein
LGGLQLARDVLIFRHQLVRVTKFDGYLVWVLAIQVVVAGSNFLG